MPVKVEVVQIPDKHVNFFFLQMNDLSLVWIWKKFQIRDSERGRSLPFGNPSWSERVVAPTGQTFNLLKFVIFINLSIIDRQNFWNKQLLIKCQISTFNISVWKLLFRLPHKIISFFSFRTFPFSTTLWRWRQSEETG